MIIFDLDGTLVDHEKAAKKASIALLHENSDVLHFEEKEFAKMWYDLAEEYFEYYTSKKMTYPEQRVARMKVIWGKMSRSISDEEAEIKYNRFLGSYEKNWELFPDVLSCLDAIKEKKLGVLSNGDFDGMHAWVEGTGSEALVTSGTGVNYDGEGTGLNFVKLRTWVDSMKLGIDILYMPYELTRRLTAAVAEIGFNNTNSRTTSTVLAQIQYGQNELGKRIMFWDGVPIVPTDYLVAEEENTGQGSDARAKNSSSDKQYSIFAIKFGNVFNGEGGLSYGFGATNMAGDLWKLVPFENLEDYDASGLRLVSYGALLLGSKYGLGRMCDIEDVEVIVTG